MKLLDLFCCEGGAAMGYHLAGFDVIGVDIDPQPLYPFEFVQRDALEYLDSILDGIHKGYEPGFDAVHASPPCQRYSTSTASTGDPDAHPDLLPLVRDRLINLGLPFVLENVEGAPDPKRHHSMRKHVRFKSAPTSCI